MQAGNARVTKYPLEKIRVFERFGYIPQTGGAVLNEGALSGDCALAGTGFVV